MQEVLQTQALNEHLSDLIKKLKPKRIFLVTGKQSFDQSPAAEVCEEVFVDCTVTRFADFTPNPNITEIERGISAYRECDPDIVVSIGGGSVLDVAKAVNVLAVQATPDIAQYVSGECAIMYKGKPLVAVPTTAGSGSEATHFAVVYIGGKKHSLAHLSMLPESVILDPELTYSLSPYQTAVSGVDALAQAIESMWSVQSTEESKEYACAALRLVLQNLAAAVQTPNPQNRAAMQQAAYMAGKAINISKTTASHAMSYALTMEYGIPHGHAAILTLPELLRFNSGVNEETCADPRGLVHVQSVITEIVRELGAESLGEAVEKIRKLMEQLHLPTSLSNWNVHEAQLPELVARMSVERAGNNPRIFTVHDALAIMKAIL